jgi:hypothetical protein
MIVFNLGLAGLRRENHPLPLVIEKLNRVGLGLKVSISLLMGFSIRDEERKIGGVRDGERESS